MVPNPRYLTACALSLGLLFACGVSAQDDESPIAAPAPVVETPVRSEPRAETPVRTEPRAETPVKEPLRAAPTEAPVDVAPREPAPVRADRAPRAEPLPRISAAPEPPVKPAIAETEVRPAAKEPIEERPVVPPVKPRETKQAPAKKMKTVIVEKAEPAAAPVDTVAANPPSVEPAPATPATPAIQPVQSGPVASYSPPATTLVQSRAPTTTPTEQPVLVVQALPPDPENSVKTGMTSFRYMWVITGLLLLAGLFFMGWKLFKFFEWKPPPGF